MKCGYNLGINRVFLLNFLGLHIVNSLCTIAVISRIPQHVLNCIIILIVLPLNLLNMVTRLAAGFLQQILQNQKAVIDAKINLPYFVAIVTVLINLTIELSLSLSD